MAEQSGTFSSEIEKEQLDTASIEIKEGQSGTALVEVYAEKGNIVCRTISDDIHHSVQYCIYDNGPGIMESVKKKY